MVFRGGGVHPEIASESNFYLQSNIGLFLQNSHSSKSNLVLAQSVHP